MTRSRDTADQINRINSSAANATAITVDSSENVSLTGALSTTGLIDINTASTGLPTLKFSHTNSGADNFQIGGGTPGVANSGFTIRDVDASANRLVIDSSGNVLVGTTATDTAAVGFRYRSSLNAISSVADGGVAAYFGRRSSDGEITRFRKDDATVGSIGSTSGNLWVAGATNGIRLAGGTFNPTDANGAVATDAVSLGYSNGRWKDLFLSGGVYLGGTGAANKLSSYETGNWTPVLKFGGANVGMTGTFIGKYIKVGNLLTVSGQLTLTAKGSSTGNVLVTGLPFTTGTTAVMSFTNYHLSYNSMIWGQIYANQFSIYEATTGGTRTSIDNTNFSADTSISFSATYPLT